MDLPAKKKSSRPRKHSSGSPEAGSSAREGMGSGASPSGVKRVSLSEPLLSLSSNAQGRIRNILILAVALFAVWKGTHWVAVWKMNKTLIPFTYTADGGQSGGLPYTDETGGQLNDGDHGTDVWAEDLGNGPAYEWIGWQNVEPTIVLNLGDPPKKIGAVLIHANNSGVDGVVGPARVLFAASQNGSVYGPDRVVEVPVGGTGSIWIRIEGDPEEVRYIRLRLQDDKPNKWTFISEIQVTKPGEPAPASGGKTP